MPSESCGDEGRETDGGLHHPKEVSGSIEGWESPICVTHQKMMGGVCAKAETPPVVFGVILVNSPCHGDMPHTGCGKGRWSAWKREGV